MFIIVALTFFLLKRRNKMKIIHLVELLFLFSQRFNIVQTCFSYLKDQQIKIYLQYLLIQREIESHLKCNLYKYIYYFLFTL